MPEAPDPYGSAAYQQRIFKEATAAVQARNILRGNGYYLTNPITHNDKLVETLAPSTAIRPGSSAPSGTSRPSSSTERKSTGSARQGFEERVRLLEATLRDERKTREQVEEQLAKLEKILEAKNKKQSVVE